MKHKVVSTVGACAVALLTQTASPHASAAPKSLTPRPRLLAAASYTNYPPVYTLRYVAFVAVPKTADVAAQYKTFPPVLDQYLSENSRYAMTTTPEGFIKILQAEQPNHIFKIGLAGTVVLYNFNAAPTQISDGPNPADPYALTLKDNITINQNSDTTLDFVSKGTFSDSLPATGNLNGTTGWKGENNALQIGRTFQ